MLTTPDFLVQQPLLLEEIRKAPLKISHLKGIEMFLKLRALRRQSKASLVAHLGHDGLGSKGFVI
jgi:hypothetical protein